MCMAEVWESRETLNILGKEMNDFLLVTEKRVKKGVHRVMPTYFASIRVRKISFDFLSILLQNFGKACRICHFPLKSKSTSAAG